MDEETLKKIFDPYFTTKGKDQGTGLGLFVVHGILKSMNGHIRVQSQPDQGSTFSIYFPRMKEEGLYKLNKEIKPLPRGSERILLVDDDQAIAELEQRILENLGYQVTMTTSSLKALDLFRARPARFDVVITDMNMPNLQGDDFAKKFFLCDPYTHSPLYRI